MSSMIRYATLGSNDRLRAKAFYDAVLAPLGLKALHVDESFVGYGPASGDGTSQLYLCQPFNGEPASFGNGTMLALNADTRAAVDAAHAAALAAGGQNEGAPGLRDYAPNFYAAYFRDLDGNKLALVCTALTESL
jgi:catechol 2,3-dioxygenase-like lactoylglutathione lyase family enzyme